MRANFVFISMLFLVDSYSVFAQETHGKSNTPKTDVPEETVPVPPQLSGQPANGAPYDLSVESYEFGGSSHLINKAVFEKIVEDIKKYRAIDPEDYKAKEAFLDKIPVPSRQFVSSWSLEDAVKLQQKNLHLRFYVEQVSPSNLRMTFPERQLFNPLYSLDSAMGFKSSFLKGSDGKPSYWVDFKFSKKIGDTYVFVGSEINKGSNGPGIMNRNNCTLILDAKGKILSVDLESNKIETSATIQAKAK